MQNMDSESKKKKQEDPVRHQVVFFGEKENQTETKERFKLDGWRRLWDTWQQCQIIFA